MDKICTQENRWTCGLGTALVLSQVAAITALCVGILALQGGIPGIGHGASVSMTTAGAILGIPTYMCAAQTCISPIVACPGACIGKFRSH